ncbi:hypothetical protein DFH09DRAFT_1128704 [Mycena vulgaris]|nr:hypothetical protein DFH09DRAFT_1128704 [Mycena vulgaris]
MLVKTISTAIVAILSLAQGVVSSCTLPPVSAPRNCVTNLISDPSRRIRHVPLASIAVVAPAGQQDLAQQAHVRSPLDEVEIVCLELYCPILID